MRYVIDFYFDESRAGSPDAIEVDARPALDDLGSLRDRAKMGVRAPRPLPAALLALTRRADLRVVFAPGLALPVQRSPDAAREEASLKRAACNREQHNSPRHVCALRASAPQPPRC